MARCNLLVAVLLALAVSGAGAPVFSADAAPPIGATKANPWLSEGLIVRLERARGITLSDSTSSRTVYVLFDTECPYCHQLAQRIEKSGADVQVKFVLVAVLDDASLPRAAAILDSKDPRAALAALVRNGTVPTDSGSPRSRSVVERNNGFLSALGLVATPGVVYRGIDGDIHASSGMPSDSEYLQIFRPGRTRE